MKKSFFLNAFFASLNIFLLLVAVPLIINEAGVDIFGKLSAVAICLGFFFPIEVALSRRVSVYFIGVNCFSIASSKFKLLLTFIFHFLLFVLLAITIILVFLKTANVKLGLFLRDYELILVLLVIAVGLMNSIFIGYFDATSKIIASGVYTVLNSGAFYICATIFSSFGIKSNIITAVLVGSFFVKVIALVFAAIYFFNLNLIVPLSLRRALVAFLRVKSFVSSAIINPFVEYFDRMVVAAFFGPLNLVYYSVPFSVAEKLRILPAIFSKSIINSANSKNIIAKKIKKTALLQSTLLILFACIGAIFAENLLFFWTKNQSVSEGAKVFLGIFLAGMIVNCSAGLMMIIIQINGMQKKIANSQLIQLFFYVPILFFAAKKFPAEYVALVWFFRVLVDSAVVHIIAKEFFIFIVNMIISSGLVTVLLLR